MTEAEATNIKIGLIVEALAQITVIFDEIRMLNPPIDYEESFKKLDNAVSPLIDLESGEMDVSDIRNT